MARETYPLRYAIVNSVSQVEKKFNLQSAATWEPVFLAQPGTILPVIADRASHLVDVFQWGIPLHVQDRLYENIAVENILQHWKVPQKARAVLLRLIRQRRCLVLSNCFMISTEENWQKPYCVYLPGQRLFTMAAVWNIIPEQGYGFAILTQPANHFLRKLNQTRMPLIIDEKEMKTWLQGKMSYSHITSLLRHVYSSSNINAYPVDAQLMQAETNNKQLLQPTGELIVPESVQVINEKLIPLGWGHRKGNDDLD